MPLRWTTDTKHLRRGGVQPVAKFTDRASSVSLNHSTQLHDRGKSPKDSSGGHSLLRPRAIPSAAGECDLALHFLELVLHLPEALGSALLLPLGRKLLRQLLLELRQLLLIPAGELTML